MRFTALTGLLVLSTLTPVVAGQHFAKPEPIDLASVGEVGEPVFMLARPTTSFGAVAADNWLYVLGGYEGPPHNYYREGQSADFYRVNLLNPSHVEALPNTQRLQSCPLEYFGGRILRIGGLVASNHRGEKQVLDSLTTVKAFDPIAAQWSALPELPAARSSHDTAIIGSRLYVIGGWNIDSHTEQRQWANEGFMLDLEHPDAGWSRFDVPFQRRALASVARDGSLVVIGGIDSNGDISSRVDLYDTTTDTWTHGPDFPSSAFGVATEVVGDQVVASASDGRVFAWRQGDDHWRHIATLTFPRFFHQILSSNDDQHLYFLGGISRGVRPRHVERLTLADLDNRSAKIHHWKIPTPSRAKNRQAIFIEDGWLYAFGGNTSTAQHDFNFDNFLAAGDRLSLANFQWRETSPLPHPRQSMQTVRSPDGTSRLAVGGFAHDGDVARTFDDGFTFNFKNESWHDHGRVLPEPRSQYAIVERDKQYYIFGGLDYDSRRQQGDRFRHLLDILTADATKETLRFSRTGLKLPRPRRAFGSALLDDKFYLVGGIRDGFQIVEQCDVFNFQTQQFESIPTPARPRLSPELVALGGRLYLAGGSSPQSDGSGLEPNPTIEMFDPKTQRWTTVLDEIPISPKHMSMFEYRGRLLVFSTHTDEANLAHVILIEPATSADAPAMTRRAVEASGLEH